jgi:hypothetical protein
MRTSINVGRPEPVKDLSSPEPIPRERKGFDKLGQAGGYSAA